MSNRTLAFTLTLLAAGCTRDLRPDTLSGSPSPAAAERGRALLARAEAAHGGRAAYEAHRVLTVAFRDVWQGIARLVNPWPEASVHVRMDIARGPLTVRATFLEGDPKDERWLVVDGRPRVVAADGATDDAPDDDVRFILAALQYFFQFPFRIGEASIVMDAGPETVRGRTYDRVFATWERLEPDTAHDQFLVYLEQDTGQVAMIHFTVRDLARFAESTMHFQSLRPVAGMLLPHRLVLTDTPADAPDDWLRVLTVEAMAADTVEPAEITRPGPR